VVAAVHPLVERYVLRAGDALQRASALMLRQALGTELVMVVYDKRLHHAARAEGFGVRPRALVRR
jgi:hypothetical protein